MCPRTRSSSSARSRSSRKAGPRGAAPRGRRRKSRIARHVRHRRLRRGQERGRDHRGRAQAAGVPRLRLRGGGRARRGRPAGAARGRTTEGPRERAAREARDGVHRHRPHALGDARASVRGERASAHGLRRPARRRAQRDPRELSRDQGAAGLRRPHVQVADGHRGPRASHRAPPARNAAPRAGGEGGPARGHRLLRGGRGVGGRGRIAPETGSVVLPDVSLDPSTVKAIQRVVLVACGTAWHAAMLTRMMVERLAGIPAEVDLASEFRYRDAIVGPETLVIAVSQSGETADTIGAVKAARLKGCPILAVTNVVGSALAREATGVLQMHAGPEIGVASTKAFSTMIVAGYLLGLWLGRQRGALTVEEVKKHIQNLVEIPRLVEKTLELDTSIAALARHLSHATDFLYLGRGVQFPIALEGALKLKEISYIHAEGYAGGEMKHGPIALIADGLPVVALAPRDSSYDRMLGNMEEVRARDGLLIAVCHPGDRAVASKAQHVIEVPPCAELLAPLLTVIPLQLLAYHVAVRRGCDVDQPRNLAKSVTVE